ncbi:unnamed protein product [Medioppia subpectinata]|uniref:NADP-dependent oxidoreductase domain-containing protein n=1 Tax=Medioppia subpectinata TaxID=1979941 RepID=A0A7R9KMK7_9ACAR|nr:unnamed protein product [Medioppia subpectinata]CAG2106301.1 unnamed protein product [Medioppia subpectinata]
MKSERNEGEEKFPKNAAGEVLVSDVDFVETYLGLEDLLKTSKVKSIGVSNFNSQQIDRILKEATVKPVVNQVECHPYLNQTKLIEFCRQKDIVVTAYSPLGSPDRPWAKPEDPSLLEEPKIKEIAKKYNKSSAQILIRFQVERGVAVIPKSVTKDRIASNINVFDFQLTPEDLATISDFDRGHEGRIIHLGWNGPNVVDHKHYPFKTPF